MTGRDDGVTMPTMPKPIAPPAFHAFSFEGRSFSGMVDKFELTEGILSLTYSYALDGVGFVGSFDAEQTKDGAFIGAWKEDSDKPVRGQSSWSGASRLTMIEADGRRSFVGSWSQTQPPVNERWMIDGPA